MTAPSPAIFDGHSDLPFRVVRERAAGREAVIAKDFLPGMATGSITARVAAVYVDDEYLPEMALHRALAVLSELHADAAESEGIEIATTADGLRAALDGDAVTLVLGMEGAEPLMGDPRLLDAFYRQGVRLLTLTHSRRNALGEGAPLSLPDDDVDSRQARTPGGLSETGVKIIRRAEELGVIVDISHLNDPGVADALSIAVEPLVASHSNCRSVCRHPRNLTDKQVAAVADTGGVICLTAVGSYLAHDDPTLADFCDHVEHAVDVAGIDHVGLGFDFFGYMLTYATDRERERLADISMSADLKADDAVADVPRALTERGFSEAEVAAICGENLQRTFKRALE